MEKTIENFTDYFLRYSANVPADEVEMHQKFNRDCSCKPSVTFDDMNGWHTIIHQSLEINTEDEIKICEICEQEIETLDGFTSCACEDSGRNYPHNYCARCERTALECFCPQGFAYDERDKY